MTMFGNRKAFTESEAASLFWSLMEMNIVPTAAFDGEQFIACNQAFLDMIGYTPEDFANGVNWKVLTPKEHLARDEACMEELKTKTISSYFEKEYFRKNGSRVKFIHHNCVIQPGVLKGIAVFIPI